MNESTKQKAGLVYNVVESVILAMSVGLMVWLANVVIVHGNQLSRQEAKAEDLGIRVTKIEITGSTSLVAHEKEDDQRVDDIKSRVAKLETAVLALQATPGKLEAIGVSLQVLQDGQRRIEAHMEKIQK